MDKKITELASFFQNSKELKTIKSECPSMYGLNDSEFCSEFKKYGCVYCWEQAIEAIKDE